MEKEVNTAPWIYVVFVSKDSPNNVYRGMFPDLPDNEHGRGYYHPVTYTELKEAQSALAYFEKGFIEKSRTVITRVGYKGVIRESRETVRIQVNMSILAMQN